MTNAKASSSGCIISSKINMMILNDIVITVAECDVCQEFVGFKKRIHDDHRWNACICHKAFYACEKTAGSAKFHR